MTTYHIHHITPKHAGGSDEPSNLIKVTIQEHASFHYERWVYTGDICDFLAWKGLLGMITNSQLIRELQSLGGKKGSLKVKNRISKDPVFAENRKMHLKLMQIKSQLPESRKKSIENQKEAFKQKQHQKGSKNSQYGKKFKWVNNKLINKKIEIHLLDEFINNGYDLGRIKKF